MQQKDCKRITVDITPTTFGILSDLKKSTGRSVAYIANKMIEAGVRDRARKKNEKSNSQV